LTSCKQNKSRFDIVLTPQKLITVLFNTKNLVLVSFNTEKYIQSHDFLQVIIYKVTTALKEREISFKLVKRSHPTLVGCNNINLKMQNISISCYIDFYGLNFMQHIDI
jgi:hypothetical protein